MKLLLLTVVLTVLSVALAGFGDSLGEVVSTFKSATKDHVRVHSHSRLSLQRFSYFSLCEPPLTFFLHFFSYIYIATWYLIPWNNGLRV